MPFKDLAALLDTELPQEGSSGAQPRPPILVIDDDETIRMALATLFSARYEVLLCASAEEGLASMREEVCAAIIDVRMPGHDGFWACGALRERCPELPVIFYSAYQDLLNMQAIRRQHQPFDYLTKDGDQERLVQAVDMAVKLHQMAQESRRLLQRLRTAPPKVS